MEPPSIKSNSRNKKNLICYTTVDSELNKYTYSLKSSQLDEIRVSSKCFRYIFNSHEIKLNSL